MKKVTMQDVADLAGVSQASVSLILNGSEKITFSNETKEKVFAAAKQLDYKVPKRKKQRSRKSNRVFLLLVPSLDNQYYFEVIQNIEMHADRQGYRVIVVNTFRRPELEKFYLTTLPGQQTDGIIFAFLPTYPRMIEKIAENVPVVIISEKQEDLSICSIELTAQTSGSILAEHLYQLGHRHFAFLTTPFHPLIIPRQQRLEGFRSQLEKHGLGPENLQVLEADLDAIRERYGEERASDYHIGRMLTANYLEHSPIKATALVGINDTTAIGILNELQWQDYEVPNDFSVGGFDNIFITRSTTPGLTTIDQHLSLRCKTAIDMLLQQQNHIAEGSATPFINKVEYTPQLVIRGSTAPPRKSLK